MLTRLLFLLCLLCIANARADDFFPVPLAEKSAPGVKVVVHHTPEQLNQVTLPPAPPDATLGVDEPTIHQYFDQPLSSDSRKALDTIAKQWEKQQQEAKDAKPIVLKRENLTDSIDNTVQPDNAKVKSMGMTINQVSANAPPSADDLKEQAYNALIAGQTEAAISLYKKALKLQPDDRLALFGLATSYHRNGETAQARRHYLQILAKYPDDRDTLNNFMALISEESPEGALPELQQLEIKNPSFSPISAQIGMIYKRLGRYDQAIQYLKKAIALSPENLSYRYNLAILFDQLGRKAEAAMLYRQLITASQTGLTIPGDPKAISDRLVYITSP